MITSDKDLLKLAAKAAEILPSDFGGEHDLEEWWNPLTDDGDALRLAVKCNLWIGQHDDGVTVSDAYARFKGALEEDYGTDPYASTRRAIVRAAAKIGESMC